MTSFRIENILKKEGYLHLLFWVLYLTYPLLKYIDNKYIVVQWITANSNIILLIITVYVCYYFFFPRRNSYKIPLLLLFFGSMTFFGTLFSKYILNLYIYHLDDYS
ncbi:hypothetical protein [Kordia sp.]|uniref:hypothetical protein n=1 Tax=Kordia sp. TaxID=1965332 RepID=UPI0025BC80CB|nr:hypothetical protein [Kordia sp.]MCH2196470.1 hypothetical protein [Kordia sp.]